LQPIVENSIKYGMQKRKALNIEIGFIHEKSEMKDHYIVMVVRDNGPGIKEEELKRLNELLQMDPMINRDSGFGITNVHARIVMMFGNQYGLTIHSEVDKGTEVLIKIPQLSKKQVGNGDE
jgi:two-component system sensor histidine kinase YesM